MQAKTNNHVWDPIYKSLVWCFSNLQGKTFLRKNIMLYYIILVMASTIHWIESSWKIPVSKANPQILRFGAPRVT